MSIAPAIIAAVQERADGYCEACGGPARGRMVHHHRLLRSRGGKHTVENLIFIHDPCHVSIHSYPARSNRLGHMVPTGVDPATVPVVVARDLLELRA